MAVHSQGPTGKGAVRLPERRGIEFRQEGPGVGGFCVVCIEVLPFGAVAQSDPPPAVAE